MSIFGAAKRGFGMLKKGKKGIDPKKRLDVIKKASQKIDREHTIKKAKRVIKDFKTASERAKRFSDRQKELVEQGKKLALSYPHPVTKIPEGKTWVGRINPDGTHVRPKKKLGGIIQAMKKANKLKGVHGGKGMIALGAGATGTGLVARHQIKKFEKEVKAAGGLDEYYAKLKKKSKKKQEK